MADLTPEGLERIEGLAKAATPGERKVELDCFHEHHISVTVGTPPDYDFFVDLETSVAPNSAEAFNIANQSQQWKDAEFIAAANPETVLALVAEVKRLRIVKIAHDNLQARHNLLVARVRELERGLEIIRDYGSHVEFINATLDGAKGGKSL